MNIDILHRPTALENLLAGRIWPAGLRLPMHGLKQKSNESKVLKAIENCKNAEPFDLKRLVFKTLIYDNFTHLSSN